MKYDVFISHSSADLELSEKICDYLQEQGIKCWIDSRNVTGLYAKSIIEGIENSELMVLIYSGNANNSAHVENEIDNAFCLGKTIIPFRIEGVPYSTVLRYYLNKSHYVNGVPEPLNALEQLRSQIMRNISEQKELEVLDEAFRIVAKWVDINVDSLYEILKRIKDKKLAVNEDSEKFKELLNEFIEREFDDDLGQEDNFEKETDNSIQPDKVENGAISNRYEILENAAGEILIIIGSRDGKPENPRLVYDGGDTMLLYRSKESAVLLTNIDKKARENILKVEEALVVETKDDDVACEYKAPMRKIKKLQNLIY